MLRCRLWCLTVVALSLGAPPAGLAAVNPKQAEKSFKEGLRLEEANQWKEAEAAYSEAILADPSGAAYYLHRARVRFYTGDYPQALEDAGSATRLEPKNGDAFLLLADIDGRMKNPRKAVAEYTRAIELGLDTAAVYNSRAAAAHATARIRSGYRRLHARYQAAPGRSGTHSAARRSVQLHWAAIATPLTTTTKASI